MHDFFTKDFGWKLLSLLLAITVYFTVKGRAPNETPGQWETKEFTKVPVRVTFSATAEVRDFRIEPDTVNVTIRARPEVMSGISERDIQVSVDLSTVESARGLRQRVVISLPPGVTLVRTSPSELNVVVPPRNKN
jgi:YbbR domain-containing protein